MQVFVGIGSNI